MNKDLYITLNLKSNSLTNKKASDLLDEITELIDNKKDTNLYSFNYEFLNKRTKFDSLLYSIIDELQSEGLMIEDILDATTYAINEFYHVSGDKRLLLCNELLKTIKHTLTKVYE